MASSFPHLPPKAAIIDLDGVMLDSLGVWSQIDSEFVVRHGVANGDVVVERLKRIPSLMAAGEYLHGECGLDMAPREIADEFVELLGEHYRHTLQLFPGVLEALAQLRDAGVAMSMVTASPEIHALPAAERTGILPFFLHAYYDEPKTSPDIFLRAAVEMGFGVADTVVIDDNPDIRAVAESAGFTTLPRLVG
jgi:HAD superfamily hydrolase (TIGR01509 family)